MARPSRLFSSSGGHHSERHASTLLHRAPFRIYGWEERDFRHCPLIRISSRPGRPVRPSFGQTCPFKINGAFLLLSASMSQFEPHAAFCLNPRIPPIATNYSISRTSKQRASEGSSGSASCPRHSGTMISQEFSHRIYIGGSTTGARFGGGTTGCAFPGNPGTPHAPSIDPFGQRMGRLPEEHTQFFALHPAGTATQPALGTTGTW